MGKREVNRLNTYITLENKNTNGKAIGSFILGLIAIFGIPFIDKGRFLSIVGLLLGIIGVIEIKKFEQNGRVTG